MKKKLLLFTLLVLGCARTWAQPNFDLYSGVSCHLLAAPAFLSGNGTTNTPQDLQPYIGVASVIISGVSNVGGGTMTFSLQEATAPTNAAAGWTILTNVNISTWTSTAVTNYATGLITTNLMSTQGSGYTSSSSIVITNNTSTAAWQIGFPVRDHLRYIRACWAITGGSSPTFGATAVLVSRKAYSN